MASARPTRATLDLFWVTLAAGYGQFAAVAALGEVARHFGHSTPGTSFSDVVGLSALTLGVGLAIRNLATLPALPLASLADRFGRKPVLTRTAVAGLLVAAAATLSPNYWAFVAIFTLARPLLQTAVTLAQVVTVELSGPQRRATQLMWLAAGDGIGSGLAAVLHGLIPGNTGFRILFASALVPAILVRPLLRRVSEPDVAARTIDEGERARLGAISRPYLGPMLVISALCVVVGVVTGPANGLAFVYAENVLHISRHAVSLVVVLSGPGGLVGLVGGRWVADNWGRRSAVAIGIVSTTLASTLAYSGGRWPFIWGYLSGVFAASFLAPAANALYNEVFPHAMRATAQGWALVAGVVGGVAGLIVFCAVADSTAAARAVDLLRVPALVTFLPMLPVVVLLVRLPETRGRELV